MATKSFEGNTFMAYTDIAGFRKMMRSGKALEALDAFYSGGYKILKKQAFKKVRIDGFFISDCGVLFTRNSGASKVDELQALLTVVKEINQLMARSGFMLMTSIAYGFFKYEDHIDLEIIKQNAVEGGAYVKTYVDNEADLPKIQPGQCRIIRESLPEEVASAIAGGKGTGELSLTKKYKSRNHYYYWWMAPETEGIASVENMYNNLEDVMYWGLMEKIRLNLG
ncbi:MAG: hypothetical protein ABRQ26_09420 [Syntrophomonadaceae bacterium]